MTELAGGTVPSAFDRVARSYDLMVALSPGYHAQLRSSALALVEALPATPGRRPRVVDLGCGSGCGGSSKPPLAVAASRDESFNGRRPEAAGGTSVVARSQRPILRQLGNSAPCCHNNWDMFVLLARRYGGHHGWGLQCWRV